MNTRNQPLMCLLAPALQAEGGLEGLATAAAGLPTLCRGLSTAGPLTAC